MSSCGCTPGEFPALAEDVPRPQCHAGRSPVCFPTPSRDGPLPWRIWHLQAASVAFCSPAKSLTFSGLLENPLLGNPNIQAKCTKAALMLSVKNSQLQLGSHRLRLHCPIRGLQEGHVHQIGLPCEGEPRRGRGDRAGLRVRQATPGITQRCSAWNR